MNEAKFSCPTCDQHIECDKSYAGHKISCPGCKAEIRIPLSGCFANGAVPKADLILAPPASAKTLAPDPPPKPAETIAPPSVPKVASGPEEIQIPKLPAPVSPPPRPAAPLGPVLPEPAERFAIPSAVEPKPVESTSIKIPADAHEANCICPVCKSELRLPVEAVVKPQGTPPVAELVPKAPKPVVALPTPTPTTSAPAAPTAATPVSATQVPATLTTAAPAAAAPAAAAPTVVTPTAATPTPAPPAPATPSLPKVESEEQLDEIPPDEREQQLAEARKAHPVSTYATVKPRMAYILSGGEAPIPKDTLHPSAVRLKKEEPKKEEPKSPPTPPIKTVTE